MRSITLLVLSTYAVIVASTQATRLHKSDHNGLERDNSRGTDEETTELQGHQHEPESKELHREAEHYVTKEQSDSQKNKSGHNLIESNAKSFLKHHKRTLSSKHFSVAKRSLDESDPWSIKYDGQRWNVLPRIVNEPSYRESGRVRASGRIRGGGRWGSNVEEPPSLWKDSRINPSIRREEVDEDPRIYIPREEVDEAPRIYSRNREHVPWAYSPPYKKAKVYRSPARSRRQPVNLVD
ncbi:unnamed protein product [Cylicocyclus nassatus]|uniref:Uncharacterized protein n=1 Tax=Cylicocyclus nassatus TaxID=53992 RepID=A0AA36H2I4_CYLNA|nr:unnamed protein product [Cylicocyclus nassatus]